MAASGHHDQIVRTFPRKNKNKSAVTVYRSPVLSVLRRIFRSKQSTSNQMLADVVRELARVATRAPGEPNLEILLAVSVVLREQ